MKKMIFVAMLAVGLLSVGSVSWAVPIYGDEDLLKGSGFGPSNPANKAIFVNKILGTSFVAADLVHLAGASWSLVGPSHAAFELSDDAAWFLVKAGPTLYLYENKDALGWAYFDFADAGMATNRQGKNIGIGISRYSKLNVTVPAPEPATLILENIVPAPEPATMLLFGTGIAILFGSRLRRKK